MAVQQRVAIVTGASAGVGRAYALALASTGATVIAAARTLGDGGGQEPARNSLLEVVKAAADLPGRIEAQPCDVEIEADIVRLIEQVIANFGRIDILVNNAAVMKSYPPLDIANEDWDRMMRVNLRAPYLTIRETAPHMIRQRSGSIVNITAGAAGFVPKGDGLLHGTLPYAVSKAGLNRLTYFMSEELKEHGIAVNALSPGIVMTDTAIASHAARGRPPRGKPPTPEVLGPALLYLAEQRADTMTGQILHTDEFGKSWPKAD